MEQIRSFIAIELPDEIKTGLSQLQAQLKAGGSPRMKWVDPAGIHLTLKFLGDIPIDSTGDITKAIEIATQGIPPFPLELKGLGVFPNLRRVQVVWVGISGEIDKLSQLQQRLESELARLGFAPESRQFKPHLTVARLRDRASPDERQKVGQLISAGGFEESHPFEVAAISLMKSQLTREGAIYHRISSVELKEPLSTATA